MAPHGGMGDSAVYPYLLGMREELYVAQRAEERLWEARERWLEVTDRPVDDDLFGAIEGEQDMIGAVETLLTAHTRLSLYLFPAYDRPRAKARGIALRRRLGIADDHPMSDRDARNSWMHLDEELDRAVFERGEEYVELYRVTRRHWPSGQAADRRILFLLNADAPSLTIAGKTWQIRQVISEINAIAYHVMRVSDDLAHRLGEDSPAEGENPNPAV